MPQKLEAQTHALETENGIESRGSASEPVSDSPPAAPQKSPARILAPILVLALVAGFFAWRHYAAWESTDDAQIDGYINPISSRIAGYVTKVTVDDNDEVKAGQVLVEIDPTDYQVAISSAKAAYANDLAAAQATDVTVPLVSVNTTSQLRAAEADVENAKAGIAAAGSQLNSARAALTEAEAHNAKAQDDVARYKQLIANDEISQQQYVQAENAAKAMAASVEAAKAAVATASQQVAQARARLAQTEAALEYAHTGPRQVSIQQSRANASRAQAQKSKAALEQAQLNLKYTTIVAPVDGLVGARTVQLGQYVAPGQQLMSIVPLENIWVTANFKETQLRHMRPGQPVKIHVDAYGHDYDGHLDSIAGASGSLFSLMPPENATGNYVKVVQRIPVKILIDKGQDPNHLLRPGMSVEPRVKVK